MKRSYPSEAEKRRDKKECGQTPQIVFFLFAQTPLSVNTVNAAAAPLPNMSFTSVTVPSLSPAPAPENDNNVPMHRTILRRGQDPLLSIERCSVCCNMYHCNYCTMLHKYLHEAQNHVTNHFRNAVQREGFVIIKCGLGCRQTPHFHCCYCTSTLIRRDALIKHLTTCKNTSYRQSPPTVSQAAPPPSTAKVPPSEIPPFPADEPPSTADKPPSEGPPSPADEPPSTADEPPSEGPPSPADKPPSTADKTPSEGPPSPADEPPSPADEPPSTADEPPSTADEPPSLADKPPSTADKTPSEGPPSEGPPSPADEPPSPADEPPSERPSSPAKVPPSPADEPSTLLADKPPSEEPPYPAKVPPSTADEPPSEGPPSTAVAPSSAMHRTILRRGQDPLLSIERCSVCCNMYHCNYCTMLHKYLHEAQNHVTNHFRNAVQREGFVIIKCGLGCRQTPHFHCCYCTSTLIRRDALIKHLTTCKNTSYRQPPPTVSQAAPPPSTAKVPPSEIPPTTSDEHKPPSEGPPTPSEGPPSTAKVTPSTADKPPSEGPPSTAVAPSSAVRLRVRQQVRVSCTHCGIQINKKNLLVHINRKHRHNILLG
ncbi:uncharacterized protein LOC143720635 isoform X4 [Siphateles boraxobius]|uniref:uncharacterized protein LOC143720635 isoform X4 n=1 Tax=Siphateles boraxobius TaxID=180520 RepID=UPI0040642B19